MNFHDADFLYSISQEHIKYTSIVLKMNMSKLTRRFFCLYWPGFSCGLSVKDFVSSLNQIIVLIAHCRFFYMFLYNEIENQKLISSSDKKNRFEWYGGSKEMDQNTVQRPSFIQLMNRGITLTITVIFCFIQVQRLWPLQKKTLHFMPRLQLWFFPLMFHVRMKQIRGL